MEHETRKSPTIVPLLVIIGGILIIASYFPHWGRVASVSGPGHRDLKGGTIVLIAGIVGVVLGLALWALRSRGARILVSIVAIVGGLLAIIVGATGFSKTFIRDTVADQLADENGISHKQAEQELKASEQAGTIKTSTKPGIYFALAGGVLVLIGGIGGVATGRSRCVAAPVGAGGTGVGPPPPPVFRGGPSGSPDEGRRTKPTAPPLT